MCDGADNDCDATVDDGTDVPTTCGVGSCAAAGVIACVGGAQQPDTCTPGGPTAEVCDGADNDCDGAVDDGTDVPTTCGVGSCAASGVIACVLGAPQPDTCSPGSPSGEVCDGVDNDCDGAIDEEPEASGSCDDSNASTTDTCNAGTCEYVDGGELVPAPDQSPQTSRWQAPHLETLWREASIGQIGSMV